MPQVTEITITQLQNECLRMHWRLHGLMEFLILDFESHSNSEVSGEEETAYKNNYFIQTLPGIKTLSQRLAKDIL